jgi:hypothetical protein
MSDIVERLRAWSPLIAAGLEAPAASLTMDEAAAEIERLREQLHLANIDAVGAHAEANELRTQLAGVVSLVIRLIDTRRCSISDLRTLNAARAALEATP